MRAARITAILAAGAICMGCSWGRHSPQLAHDNSNSVVFDGGKFAYRHDLNDVGDTLRVEPRSVVLGAKDGQVIVETPNPFCPPPLIVYVVESDSVRVRLFSVKGDTLGDYGTHFISTGTYSLYFADDSLGYGVYLVQLGYRGQTRTSTYVLMR